tara:strand:+ start:7264 stop:7422 length:159 start_codon:yes stop_codon:yes gene_type:complete
MPNRKAKARKQERRKKNDFLKKNGRTAKQIARIKRRKKNADNGLQGFKKRKW